MGSLHQFRRFVGDSLTNLVNGLGSAKDSFSYSRYNYNILDRVQLENAYRGDWLARAIVDAPAEDATREWRDWQTDQSNIEKLEKAEKQFDLQRKLKRALILARLYGGSAIVMGVNQGKAEDELDIERVKGDQLRFIEVFHQFELTPGNLIRDIESPWFNRPEYYQLGASIENINRKQISSVQIHPSRVIALVGNEIPDIRAAGNATWGDSVLQSVDDAVKATGTVVQGIASMIADCKMDVVKIPGLAKHLADDELSTKLIERFALANQMKSMVNTLLLDEKEEWQRIQTSFAALPQLIQEFLTVAAGAAGIPISRLIGQARGKGIGGTEGGGEVDTRTYYDHISDMQRNELSPTLTPLDEVFIRSVLGHEDEKIYYEWSPLWQMSEAEKADIANKKAVTTQADVTMALINPDVLRDIRVNQLIEDGTYPGIEDAIDEYGSEPEPPPDPTPTPEDLQAHVGMMQKSASTLTQLGKHAVQNSPALQRQLAPPKPKKKIGDEFLADYNTEHEPGGSSKGGQFASKHGTSEDNARMEKKFGEEDTSSTPAQNLLHRNHSDEHDTFDKVLAQITPKQHAMIDKAEAEMANQTPTNVQFKDENGHYTPEREELQRKILRENFLTPERILRATPAPGEKPTLILSGGRPAAGKSFMLRSELGDALKKSFDISADDIQVHLPGYNPAHAGIYNGEAQDMADDLERAVRTMGLNITFDATMKSTKPAHERVDTFKRASYDVHGYFAHSTPTTSAVRTAQRFEKEGRYVPPMISFKSRTNEATFDSLIPKLDKWAVYDNNGATPRRVAGGSRK